MFLFGFTDVPTIDCLDTGRSGAPNIPAIRPPGPTFSSGTETSLPSTDLLRLDTPPNQLLPSLPSTDLFEVRSPPAIQPPPSPSCIGDVRFPEKHISNELFMTGTSAHAAFISLFTENWSLSPASNDTIHSLPNYSIFNALSTLTPLSPLIFTTPSTSPVHVKLESEYLAILVRLEVERKEGEGKHQEEAIKDLANTDNNKRNDSTVSFSKSTVITLR
ncbi:hypothetical protein KIN20_015069 [Parelaphostrongylus tenuis]|uniref:Uncharacterized protein n=1 Tax=Parelaphostrongylus tenuis TaxID=148309 RepID=A0AAD5MZR6_PARTN|nr:hypothetical protein KIN20_015069 [Parelaphostrongylus tenuis]